ncbi:MAG: RsmB/NOP family class I SAM-dependent RNA methyltransferase [Pseudomonadota bacterium]
MTTTKNNAAPKPRSKSGSKQGLPSRDAAVLVLTRVIDDKRGLDSLLDGPHALQSYMNLAPNDQALTRAIVTSALRRRGDIEKALLAQFDRPPPKNARHLIHTLHCAAAQILFLDVPDSAAVDLAVSQVAGNQASKRFKNLTNAVLRGLSRNKEVLAATTTNAEGTMAPWLFKRLRSGYGREKARAIAEHHLLEPSLDLQVKENPELWASKLEGVALFGSTIRTLKKGRIQDWDGYEGGAWWVQDAAAALPVALLGTVAGRTVCDLCAAPGGKTAQLAALGASVTAVERNANRSIRLRENMARLQFDVELIETDFMNWETDRVFDAVLLDAPCSSTGTIRRHPDVQWTKTASDIDALAALQKTMILAAAKRVAPGGTLVFANCSIDRAEGEDIVAQLGKGPLAEAGLELDPIAASEIFGMDELITGQGTLRSLPFHGSTFGTKWLPSDENGMESNPHDQARLSGLDGFFAARFKKQAH